MITAIETRTLDELLGPFQDSLTPEMAQKLVVLRASPEAQTRLETLSARNAAGLLTPEEQAQYSALVHAGAVISLLQAKAKRVLRSEGPA